MLPVTRPRGWWECDDLPCPASDRTVIRRKVITKLIEALGVNGPVERLERKMEAGPIYYREKRFVGDHCPSTAA